MLFVGAIGLTSLSGPSSALDAWRNSRLLRWARTLDRRFDREYHAFGKSRVDLRYRTQILIVDDDPSGVRARACEAVLDKLCESVDADVDAMTSSIGSAAWQRPPAALCDVASAAYGLSRLPLEAGSRQLRPEDLLVTSRWDLIVCCEGVVLERVRSLARAANAIDRGSGSLGSLTTTSGERSAAVAGGSWADVEATWWQQWSSHPSGEGTDAFILCATDFLASGVPAANCAGLPEDLRRLVAPLHELGDAQPVADQMERTIVDLPSLGARGLSGSAMRIRWSSPEASSAFAAEAAGAEDTEAAEDEAEAEADDTEGERRLEAYDEWADLVGAATVCCSGLLTYLSTTMHEHAARLYRADLVASLPGPEATWEEARAAMKMEHGVPGGLSEDERRGLFEEHVSALRKKAPPTRVDVSDLGLTMDDMQGPMGGSF